MTRSKTAIFQPTPVLRGHCRLAAFTLFVLGACIPAVCAQDNPEAAKGAPNEHAAESAKDEHGDEGPGERGATQVVG